MRNLLKAASAVAISVIVLVMLSDWWALLRAKTIQLIAQLLKLLQYPMALEWLIANAGMASFWKEEGGSLGKTKMKKKSHKHRSRTCRQEDGKVTMATAPVLVSIGSELSALNSCLVLEAYAHLSYVFSKVWYCWMSHSPSVCYSRHWGQLVSRACFTHTHMHTHCFDSLWHLLQTVKAESGP